MSWLDEIIEEVQKPQTDETKEITPPEQKDAPQGQETAPEAKHEGKMTYCPAFYEAFARAPQAPAQKPGDQV